MRVGIDASNIRSGGGVTHLVETLSALVPEEHGISEVIVWSGRRTLAQLPDRPWLRPSGAPSIDGSLLHRTLWQRRDLPRLARAHCEVLFTPGASYPGSFRPFVTAMQNLLPFEASERRRYGLSWMHLRCVLLERAQWRSFREAGGLIFLSEYPKKILLSQGEPTAELRVIPCGVDHRFRREPRAQRPLTESSFAKPFRFLYVSIVDVYKHQWHVVKAVAELRRQGLPVALDLIGPAYPPSLERLRATIDEVDPRHEFVVYHGAVPYHELPGRYAAADGFVFASTCETFGQILTEAMLSGLPIACSNRSAMPELLRDGGVYFDPENPPDIARAMRQLLEDATLRTRCAEAAFRRAQTYSWERCARETFAFLREVAQRYATSA